MFDLQDILRVHLKGFEPPTRGLGKRGAVLHRSAENCEPRISKPFFLPQPAQYCRVLRSRWCQSGVTRCQDFPRRGA